MAELFPFHSESERDFYAHLGLYTRLWSAIELNLEQMINFIYRFRQGAIIERDPPLSLDRRLSFLIKASKRLPGLASEEEEIVAMMEFLKEESAFRHLIIHGIKLNHLKCDPHYSFLSRPIKRKFPTGERQELIVSQADLEGHYEELGHLGLCLSGAMERLLGTLESDLTQAGS